MRRSRNRRYVERLLLTLVSAVLALGFALVYGAKKLPEITAPITSSTINLNAASVNQIAAAYRIPVEKAATVIERRHALPGGKFTSVYSAQRDPILSAVDPANRPASSALVVHTPEDSSRAALTCSLLFLAAAWFGHLLLTRKAPDADPYLLPLAIFLSGIGLIAIYSVKDPLRDAMSFLTQTRGVVIVGIIAAALPFLPAFSRLRLHRYGFAYAIAALGLMIVLMSPLGHGPGGAKVTALGFEPIEAIKILLVLFMAAYLAERRTSHIGAGTVGGRWPELVDIVPLALLYLFVLLLFAVVKDMGPAVLLYATLVAVVYLVTGRAFYPVAAAALILLAGVAGYYAHLGFFATRVDMWLHPWDNAQRLGGQLAMGLWGLATGGLFGTGLGLGDPAAVPRSGSDMVFTTIGEEGGVLATLTVLVAYAVIVHRGYRIARNAADDFDRLLAAGLTTLIGIQAIVITAGSTGVAPLTGVTLPFVSYGTSSLAADFFSLGLLLRISAKRLPDDVPQALPSVYPAASRAVITGLCTALLLIIGGRLVYIQGIADEALASRTLTIPDADGVRRPHINPRLLALINETPRGRILDRRGRVLAREPLANEQGTRILAGRPRVYPYGRAAANILLAAELPGSPSNPLGCDGELSGLGNSAALLTMYRGKDLPDRKHLSGSDVHLTIDIDIQQATQTALDRAARKAGSGRGAAVVIDARTGDLLAAATTPTFDPERISKADWNALHEGGDPANPLMNRAFSGVYPPGSTFKLVTAAAALESHRGDFTLDCRHTAHNILWSYNGNHYSRATVTDESEMRPHGVEDLAKALSVSCNVYYAALAVELGPNILDREIGAFQLNHCPSVGKLAEDLPDCGYGQGTILATPYEMARIAEAIANGGSMPPSRFVRESPMDLPATQPLTEANAAVLRSMMRRVVASGTARGVFDGLGVDVAGKTGSAQLASGRPHSWFAGFAPASHPSVAFACIVENGGHGRDAAGSVCREIVRTCVHE
ncbi:MAG: FtsW/RodA/SpoVE family cell cycle protein [Capsulimonadaceae bacterium]|nr:FtsW/RodA/SpoVE family cell cycle protein [Capsulimonadaceae bacterium]